MDISLFYSLGLSFGLMILGLWVKAEIRERREKKRLRERAKREKDNFALESISWNLRPEVGSPVGRKLKMDIQDLGNLGGIISVQRSDSQFADVKIFLDYTKEGKELRVQYGPEVGWKIEDYSLEELDYVKVKLAQELLFLRIGPEKFTQSEQSPGTLPSS